MTKQQKEKGLRYIQNAKDSVVRKRKEILEFSKWLEGKHSIAGTTELQLQEMKDHLKETQERLSNLQRKYL